MRLLRIFQQATYIQAISHYLAAWAKQMGATCPIAVLPNGVNLANFARVETAWQPEKKVLITTSRLVAKNGVDDLIKSLNFLPAVVTLKILGSGPEEAMLKQLVAERGLASRVSFLGQVPQERLPEHLAAASIFIRPSRSEGLGNSFLEAMAAGVPVIGTPVGGIPDFLFEGETGWLCKVHNPQSIAEKVEYILQTKNRPEVERVIAQARHLVEEKYDWDKITAQFADILRQL